MIPRIVHQIWLPVISDEPPPQFLAAESSWIAAHPGWVHRRWGPADIDALFAAARPDLLELYRVLPYWMQKVDAARWLIIHEYGGIYADLDIVCLRAFEPFVNDTVVLAPTRPAGFASDLLMAEVRHPLFKAVLDELPASVRRWHWPWVPPHFRVVCGTGPLHLTRVFKQFRDKAAVRLLTPEEYGHGDPARSFVRHIEGNTWAGWDTRVLSYIGEVWKKVVPAALLALAATSARPATAHAQATAAPAAFGSRYLSLENWAYDPITQLRRRGYLTALDPLAQPYHRIDVARALAAFGADTVDEPVATWWRLLREEFQPELARLAGRDSVSLGYEVLGGVTASTSRRLDPLLPWRHPEEGASVRNRVWPDYRIGGWFERGSFAGETRVFHSIYALGNGKGDPDAKDPGGIVIFKRTDNAYLTTAFSLGSAYVGRMALNWAPIGTGGLMLSNNPTTYPQLGLTLRSGNLRLRFVFAELDTLKDLSPGVAPPGGRVEQNRYLTANELEFRTPDFAISIGEAKLGVSAGPVLGNLNPLELFFFDNERVAQETASNTVLTGKLWVQRHAFLLFGEALLDDIHVDNKAPIRAAVSGGVQYTGVAPWLELGADYRAVSALTYWTMHYVDQWSFYRRGLGDNFSDYDRLRLHAALFPHIAGVRLAPELAIQRKGEGDFRMPPFPDDATFRSTRSFFLGVRETTVRIGLPGRVQSARSWFFDWDGGVNLVNNADHVAGRRLTEFQGVARFGLTFGGPSVGGR